ncbi:MAG: ATP-dependent DNA helicase RecG [Microgenomates group bacterium]
MDFNTPVSKLYMVGPTYARRLKRLGIETVGDLLYHFPFRYVDYSLISPIKLAQPGETITVRGKIISIRNEYTSRGKKIQKGIVADATGTIDVVWFNQPFLIKTLKIGTTVSLSGKVDFWGKKVALISPEYERETSDRQQATRNMTIHTGRLVPVYHETYGISSKWLRSRIAPLLETFVPKIEEFLPSEILKKYGLIDFKNALEQIHFPKNIKWADLAKKRFAFEELFLIQLAAARRKAEWQQKKLAKKFFIDQEKVLEFIRNLPFELTGAQKRELKAILKDLNKNKPMNRLLQGDVGSGKTVVAAAAIFVAYLNNVQSALMAPTEILAHQHFQTLNQLLTPLGVKIILLTGTNKKTETNFDLAVGTHALIYQRAKFKNLGLVVIDEQHRFGVEQRGKLIEKGETPHVLTMTATPIPRTIALTLYGDLDLSVLDEMPAGRQKVKTWVVPPQKRAAAYEWIRKQIKETQSQAFIICPLIEESNYETLQTVKAATSEFERLKKEVFPDLKLGLLHGRLKTKEKNQILEDFKNCKLDILVSTPVVEVGIDIPTATIMMIEGAERFGLAQLHQLRGRVGRSNRPSFCLLFSEHQDENSLKRLKALERTNIGMELAELDLRLRGPGEIYGTRQHGFLELKVASFSDLPLIEKTKKAAEEILPKLYCYPSLQERLKEYIIKKVEPN